MSCEKHNTTIEDVIHFFEVEIEISRYNLQEAKDNGNSVFNGVDCKDYRIAAELTEAHIQYCENIIDRIRGDCL